MFSISVKLFLGTSVDNLELIVWNGRDDNNNTSPVMDMVGAIYLFLIILSFFMLSSFFLSGHLF